MKIYVDEMPKRCIDCPCYNEQEQSCKLNYKLDMAEYDIRLAFEYECYSDKERHKDCPLNSIQTLLAEKDKEIEELKLDNKKYFTDSCRANKEIAYKLKQQNQKAIEQLEKVKTTVKHFCEPHGDEYYGVKSQVMGINQDVCECIDQRINELKGKVED